MTPQPVKSVRPLQLTAPCARGPSPVTAGSIVYFRPLLLPGSLLTGELAKSFEERVLKQNIDGSADSLYPNFVQASVELLCTVTYNTI